MGNGGGTSGDVACDEDAAWDALRNDSGIRGDTNSSGRLIFVSAIVLSIDISVSSTDFLRCPVFLSLPNADISILSCFNIVSDIRGDILFNKVLPGLTGICDLSKILPSSIKKDNKMLSSRYLVWLTYDFFQHNQGQTGQYVFYHENLEGGAACWGALQLKI